MTCPHCHTELSEDLHEFLYSESGHPQLYLLFCKNEKALSHRFVKDLPIKLREVCTSNSFHRERSTP